MAGKTNTDKIDELNVICATLSARLDVLLREVSANATDHSETSNSLAALKTQLAIVEVHVGGIEPLKAALQAITVLEREITLLKKDLDGLNKWKEESKKDKDEAKRRLWAFGPNLLAAFISALVALLVVWLNQKK